MPYLDRYDLLTANQETMIGGESHGLSTYPQFNSPKEVGDLLKVMASTSLILPIIIRLTVVKV